MNIIRHEATFGITNSADASLMMLQTTIPASQIVDVTPEVLSAGGNQIQTIGLFVTQSTGGLQGARVPIGTVQQFFNATSVSNFFGPTSHEFAMATTYFNSFTTATQSPNKLLFAQMPCTAVAAYLRSSTISTYTIPSLSALSGSLTVVVDGYTRTGTTPGGLSLTSATSYSAAATLIASYLNQAAAGGTNQQQQATGTGTATGQTASFTGSISGNVLTVTAMASGTIGIGGLLGTAGGLGILASTIVTTQLTNTSGGTALGQQGTYAVSQFSATSSGSMTETYGILSVGTGVITGTFSVGQTVTSGTYSAVITNLGTGAGLGGTYIVNVNTSTGSGALSFTAYPTPVTCTYDSILGVFNITSGIVGAASTTAYATGNLATSLFFTAATGAILSQGAAAQVPSAFMSGVTSVITDWATFTTAYDPDGGNIALGSTQKQLFAAWANSAAQNQAFLYVAWDVDPGPTLTVPDTSCFEYIINTTFDYTGTTVVYEPTDVLLECFVCGVAASINFNQTNARITFAFKTQTGFAATVTSGQVAQNLIANGYNFYGAYATASTNFLFFYPGSMSGPFLWIDSYINQIWMNSGFQNALMTLLTTVPSVPYNPAGYSLIESSLSGQINSALNFGAIRAGVVLSATQVIAANNLAGLTISTTLNQQGWYLQVLDPGATVRQARGSPVCTFWYMDGQAVQQINLTSIDVT
jgi:Protein of unknown function (DUF3383)